MLTVYTLKTCDTCKKALKWLDDAGVSYSNHDVRADGLDRETVAAIVSAVGWETAINRRSTTWRGLDDASRENLSNDRAADLIVGNPTLLKRPAFIQNGHHVVGFDAKAKASLEKLL